MPSCKYYNTTTGKWEYLNIGTMLIPYGDMTGGGSSSGGTIDPSDIDLSDYYKKKEANDRFVEEVVHLGVQPPPDTNMLWYDTSDAPTDSYYINKPVFKGIYGSLAERPNDGLVLGEICKVEETGDYYIYNGNEWEVLGSLQTDNVDIELMSPSEVDQILYED